jgi:beta-lactamase class A
VLAGKAKWDEPLAISDDLKSLPSGRMQLEAEDVEFPLSTYADLMISISDNTAADHLLKRVGRENAEAYMSRFCAEPARNIPLLSTMDLFRIKLSSDRSLADRYIAADVATRRVMLAPGGDVAKSTPSVAALAQWKSPFEIDTIEWFATTREMCRVLGDLARLEGKQGMEPLGHALRVNTGLQFDRRTWPGVMYKGGSEPGVLNMTWLLQRDDGALYALSLGWNNDRKDVDPKRAADLVGERSRS